MATGGGVLAPCHYLNNKTVLGVTSSSTHRNYDKVQRARSYYFSSNPSTIIPKSNLLATRAIKDKTDEIKSPSSNSSSSSSSSADEITEKFGLEAGLWKIFTSKEEAKDVEEGKKTKGDEAKELLAKYGGAYLVTSITLSLISFSLCYTLISAGIDVQSLLQKVGISVTETSEKVGTFALAYAAHKAASPIRFPPTVALTPIVASWIGKKKTSSTDDDNKV